MKRLARWGGSGLQKPRGTRDVLPEEVGYWHYVEQVAREVCAAWRFEEIRTPVFEATDLFERSIGHGTDVVDKEMYTFKDKAGRSLTLRPESTAPVGRAVIEGNLLHSGQVRLYYIQAHYRFERPQAGRYREHHQFGVEHFGEAGPLADLDVIALATAFLSRVGLAGLAVNLNSIGCPDCRPQYIEALRAHYRARAEVLCADCSERLEHNPMRLLDCKVPGCQEVKASAPSTLDYLCGPCREHFEGLLSGLRGLGISYALDPTIVRGLDYYTRTVFEIRHESLGAQATVCGGGRYDGLIETLGGPPTPAVGFGLGLERLILTLRSLGVSPDLPKLPQVYMGGLSDDAAEIKAREALRLRQAGFAVELGEGGRSLKAQLRHAGKEGFGWAVLFNPLELSNGCVVVRDMAASTQATVPIEELAASLNTAGKGA